ncbi:hypothetical protein GCM10022234_18260 [Aeromicrobium panaciterrae]|uniref:hypothetical protein n=1 Tax=Aeromicrobium panaciterrae TaxID=363861 RepID=UPI0031E0CB88
MREIRAALLALGVGVGLWGVWLMRDFTSTQLISVAVFLVGGVILHDAILAPVTVGIGVLGARLLPSHVRAAAGIGFLLWGTLTLAFVNVLSGQGGKPDNMTVLNRPYALSWFVMTAVLVAAVVIAAVRRRRAVRAAAS